MRIKVCDLICQLQSMDPEAYVNVPGNLDPTFYFHADGSKEPFSEECSLGSIIAARQGQPTRVMEYDEKKKCWSEWKDRL